MKSLEELFAEEDAKALAEIRAYDQRRKDNPEFDAIERAKEEKQRQRAKAERDRAIKHAEEHPEDEDPDEEEDEEEDED